METWQVWHPQTADERDAILRELQDVIASPHFCNSKRYPALLRYIVEHTLAGKADLLKERTLGAEVFDRPPTYDTNADTVVRYTAGEVRKRLLLYYSEPGHGSTIRISLPAGSYIPEFLRGSDEGEDLASNTAPIPVLLSAISELAARADNHGHEHEPSSHLGVTSDTIPLTLDAKPVSRRKAAWLTDRHLRWSAAALLILVGAVAVATLRYGSGLRHSPADEFWRPIVRDQHSVIVCTGGVVFQQNNFSGVITANKDSEYPFVSIQIASAITQVAGVLDRAGVTAQLLPSPSTPLTELREHPVVLLGAYNNKWAMRLLQSQRYRFTYEPIESIEDSTRPQVHWTRDRSQPYSSTDDYALVARFRDSTTGGWVIVLAGLGRNGTEAAAQFATSPHYMQQIKDQIGQKLSDRNIEIVMKVKVIDGKTGAPTVQAVYVR